ncbi:MAG: hypothetical protein WAM60_06565 [Candidatus Promineifilaceae bacterium]
MESREAGSRKISRRYRRAAERLVENSSLRDELNDEQAKRLLDWGSSYLKKVVNKTADLADEDAENILEAQTERVSGVMRQVNRLTRAITSGDQPALAEHLKALKGHLDGLQNTADPNAIDVEQWLASSNGDRTQLFEALMALIDGEEE